MDLTGEIAILFAVFVCAVNNKHVICFRLCTLTLTRLVLHKPLGSDLTSVIVAVKMQVRIREIVVG